MLIVTVYLHKGGNATMLTQIDAETAKKIVTSMKTKRHLYNCGEGKPTVFAGYYACSVIFFNNKIHIG